MTWLCVSQISEKTADHGCRRRHHRIFTRHDPREVDSSKDAARCRLGVSLYPRQLTRKHDVGPARGRTISGQSLREVQIAVPVNRTPAEKVRVCEARDHGEYLLLVAHPQTCLEPHHVPHLPRPVLPSKLYHSPGTIPRSGIDKPDWLHGTETKRLHASSSHHLHRQAAFEVRHVVPVMTGMRLTRVERLDERFVLCLVHRAV